MGLPCDWQIGKHKISQRGEYLLETGKWSDCMFLVGQESHQQTLKGHKLFLAMSSPVFEAMFFGEVAEKNDPIPITDVQPEAFKALMQYIYTDRIHLNSFEMACELCYCAKKYMFPLVVEECTKYIWSDLSPKKTCRVYEFAKLFDEPVLMDRCLQIICATTNEVIKLSTWEHIELGTLLTILDQDDLEIDSELELFIAVERWAKAECLRKSLDVADRKSLKSVIGNALSKIRFLSLTPQEFAEGPSLSPLLTQDEAFAILMNILCTGNKTPMPQGFSTDTRSRTKPSSTPYMNIDYLGKFRRVVYPNGNDTFDANAPSTSTQPYIRNASPTNENPQGFMKSKIRRIPIYCCYRSVMEETDCLNVNILDCSLTFSADKDICILGVKVPTQRIGSGNSPQNNEPYTEVLYAHMMDSNDTRLTYTHFTTKVTMGILVEISFNNPVIILKHQTYRIGVVFNKVGVYPLAVCSPQATCNSVNFSFCVGKQSENIRNGLIRGIMFRQ